MATELTNIKGLEKQWEDVRHKLLHGEIKYNDIERLKEEDFFNRFDDMFKDYNDIATTELSEINLLLRSVYKKDHEVSRFIPIKKDSPEWKKYNLKDCDWNRFNPSDRAFIYLGVCMNNNIKSYNYVKNTCYKELRVSQQKDIKYMSTLKFKVLKESKQKRVLDFSKISEYKSCDDILNKYISERVTLEKKGLKTGILTRQDMDRRKILPLELCVLMYIKLINDSIFKEVNTSELSEHERKKIKENEYAPFHAFANYIEGMGFVGIIYNSTVCDGLNIVLFDSSYVEPIGDIHIEKIN
ncbi:hypothetical protein [Paraclostridium sordellii]|uniref:hypothetical protein n=1 Tax=Paraclostridium sordellii TaxID=1505 RepID=UPI0005E63EEE|nr:hypothetical protein [Paeniclostridium sordellii]CEN77463.1 Uncharacterised protein [[Clostridium] sordellii] [Paeniclostridium sordellii]